MEIRLGGGLCLALALSLVACRQEHQSRNVRTLEEASAADLESAAVGLPVVWLERRPSVTLQADVLWMPAARNARTTGPENTEDRACNAARQVAGLYKWQLRIAADTEAFKVNSNEKD
jgi:hypothetical protein